MIEMDVLVNHWRENFDESTTRNEAWANIASVMGQ